MSEILRTQHLDISFGGIHAVNDVSVAIEQGKITGLIGPNGSGKSTFVNLVSGVYAPLGGTIWFDGKNIPTKTGIAERARMGITRTFQTPRAFGGLSVFESVYTAALVKYGMREAGEKAEAILDGLNMRSLSGTLAGKLPVEKRKWLDLARILAIDPKLIMMDEVMAGLNPSEMEECLELVRAIGRRGITILFIEHVMRAVVQLCDRVIVFNEGSVLCEDTPQSAMARRDVIEAYLGEDYRHAEHS